MKQGTVLNRIVMTLIFLAILIYMGGAAWRSFHTPFPTVQTYPERVDDAAEVTGFLVREELVLDGTSDIVDLIPAEGEKVAVGDQVAVLYADRSAVDRNNELEELRREAEQLSIALASVDQQGDHTGQQVVDAMVELRSAVETGDLTQLERDSLNYKSAVLQQSLRQGNTGDLSAALERIKAEIAALETQTAQNVGRVTAGQSGIFSSQVDGYESVLTPAVLEGLTPSVLESVASRENVAGSGLCKLITSSTWHFICSIPESQIVTLHEGDRVTVRFSRDWSGDVGMKVERISAPEHGKVALTLTTNRFLSDTTLLRRQTVELVFSSEQGLRVPIEAVRMDDSGVSGVYVQVGQFAEFKPVDVLAQGEDYYLVKPRLPEVADQKEKKMALRAGDPVIVAREEIWDGKVVD